MQYGSAGLFVLENRHAQQQRDLFVSRSVCWRKNTSNVILPVQYAVT